MVPQCVADALTLIMDEGIQKGNAVSIRETIFFQETQGHDCANAKAKLIDMVRVYCVLISSQIVFLTFFFFSIFLILSPLIYLIDCSNSLTVNSFSSNIFSNYFKHTISSLSST